MAGPDYLALVFDFVSAYKHERFDLKNPAGAKVTIGDLDDTIYSGKNDEVNGWGKFYLPKIVNMQVVGVVEGTLCSCHQLVLMTCENRKVYAYDGDELHEVASNLVRLHKKGIKYPASNTYYKGEAFKNMTKKDWDKVRKSAVGKELDAAHLKLVTARKSKFLEDLHQTQAAPFP